jgi:hypothetical protein
MPLHDWTELSGWEGVHDIWLVELLRDVKLRLPPAYRAYIGSTPALSVEAGDEKPDIAVRHWSSEASTSSLSGPMAPDSETVALLSQDPQTAVHVTLRGKLVAAIEVTSPRNKDRPSSRRLYLSRYLSYLVQGANLLLVDVHPRPLNFSFADGLAAEAEIPNEPPLPAPHAIAYRVGEEAPGGGRLVAVWRRRLVAGQPLPRMPLPLTVHEEVLVDLEKTYHQAATDAYLD